MREFGEREAGGFRPLLIPKAHVQQEAGFVRGLGRDEGGGGGLVLQGEEQAGVSECVQHDVGVGGGPGLDGRVQW